MNNYPYWQRQEPDKPLFPDIEWSKPEQKAKAGKLLIIGGHAQGFAAVAESFATALQCGVGEARVLLPDSLKKSLSPGLDGASLLPSNPSGGFSKDAWPAIEAGTKWADGILIPGDVGRNSETAILYEKLLDIPEARITFTRDAIDLLKHNYPKLAERENTLLILSFAQLQKLFQGVYYSKMLAFSMSLNLLVEALHKFTMTYPCTLTVLHNENLLVASQGRVSSTLWDNALAIWRGNVAANASCYWLWNPSKSLEAVTTSLVST